jgi:uncharacterized protein YqcC (DUF446 family)
LLSKHNGDAQPFLQGSETMLCDKIGIKLNKFSRSMYLQVTDLLNQIERELKATGLWALITPSAEAMQSTAPFFCDTMPLENWLQFVFLPRMRALVDGRLPLPQQIAVCPMAEEAFQPLDQGRLLLINRIADLDELLSGKREQTSARV